MSLDSLAERIIRDLSLIFKRDPNIVEFDIVPVEYKVQNKCPVLVVDHRLALESWCVQHVFKYAYEKVIEWRLTGKSPDKGNLIDWTRIILLINADISLAWNIRKELIESNDLTASEELTLSEIILTRKPKSPDSFNHRQFVLRRLKRALFVDENVISNELRVSLEAASRYQRNYYAWTHRLWVMQNLANNAPNVINYELNVTKHWVESHISDYSCFHYRQYLFAVLSRNISSQSKAEYFTMLQAELDFVSSLSSTYLDHESLYMHRRFMLKQICCMYQEKIDEVRVAEINFIDKSVAQGYNNCVSNQWQFELIRKHTVWIQRVLKWNLDFKK